MIAQLSAKVSLFLYVRTHSQVAYYLNLADSSRAANDTGTPIELSERTERADRRDDARVMGLDAERTRSRG